MTLNMKYKYLKNKQELFKLDYDGAYILLNNIRFYTEVLEGLLMEGNYPSDCTHKCSALLRRVNGEIARAVHKRHLTRTISDKVGKFLSYVERITQKYPLRCPQARNGYSILKMISAVINTMKGILSREYGFNNRVHGEAKTSRYYSYRERPHIVSIFGGMDFNHEFVKYHMERLGDTCKSELPYRFRYCYVYSIGFRRVMVKLYDRLQLIRPFIENEELVEAVKERIERFNRMVSELTIFTSRIRGYGRILSDQIIFHTEAIRSNTEDVCHMLEELDLYIKQLIADEGKVTVTCKSKKIRQLALQDQLTQYMADCFDLLEILKAGVMLGIFRICGGNIGSNGELTIGKDQGINMINDRELLHSLFQTSN
ncbi:MAG: hypothetical protein KHZ77_01350 [Veillonella sp.]|uniref:hypothetical protein n=1 Tax=Veillonella sp. TaxID=1926307 RepID=UPI0025F4915D|nr:hypothetical protein [Veillonella sp.]MBS4912794.1 hypothetical protein [Veillonella sp.]